MILSNAQIKTITTKDDPILDPFKCFKMRNTGIYFISNPSSVLVNFLDKDNISITDKGLLSIKILNKNINEEESGVIPSLDRVIPELGTTVKVAAPQMNVSQTMIPNVTKSTYVQVIYEYTTISNKYYRWSYSINADPNIVDTTKPEVPLIETKANITHTRSQQFRSDYYYTKDNKTLYSRKWDNNNDGYVIYNKTDMNNQFVNYRDEVLAEWNILKSYPTMYYPDQYKVSAGLTVETNTGNNVNHTHYSIMHPDNFFAIVVKPDGTSVSITSTSGYPSCLYFTDGCPDYTYTAIDDKLTIDNVYNGINTYRNSFYINPWQNMITFPSIIPFSTQNGNMPGYYVYGGVYYSGGDSPYFIISGTGTGDTATSGVDSSNSFNPNYDMMSSYIRGDMIVTLGHATKDKVVSIKTHIPVEATKFSYLTIHPTWGRHGEKVFPYKPNIFPTASVIGDIKTKLIAQKSIMANRFYTGIKLTAVQTYATRTTDAASYNLYSVMHGLAISAAGDYLNIYTSMIQLEKDTLRSI